MTIPPSGPASPTPLPGDRARAAARARAWASVLAALFIGIAIGVLVDRLAIHHRWSARDLSRPPFAGPADVQHHMSDRIARQLALTPAQRARVDSILARNLRDIEQVRQDVRPRMREIFARTRAQMDSVLTPEQRTKLDELFQRRRRGGARVGRTADGP
jgi:Spy/CpxP family protein refolding chaperone